MWSLGAGCNGLVRSIGRTLAWFRVGPRLASRDGRDDVCVQQTPGRKARETYVVANKYPSPSIASVGGYLRINFCLGSFARGHE